MCGIAGIVSERAAPVSEELHSMMACLRHRGPDASGVWRASSVGLAHTRLAVLDTREIGEQPMHCVRGRYSIVYNGEIYNYRELRQELESSGATFRTNTDTEVVLEAYARWGDPSVQRLNGMFAIAIWDREEQALFAARDRLGQKPFYYALTSDGSFIFASELKAILASGRIPASINPQSYARYLSCNYIPGPEAFIQGVYKLPPAHTLRLRSAKVTTSQYWDLASFFKNKRTFRTSSDAVEEFTDMLTSSVTARLVSDVPLGAFLSGGLDSSSIVSLMSTHAGAERTNTFSIGFEEETYSELSSAREIARHLSVTHRDRVVSGSAAEILSDIVFYADEPFADTSIIPVYELAAFAREAVTVCLSGDGSDEILAGYSTYLADYYNTFAKWLPKSLRSILGSVASRVVPATFGKVSFDYKLQHFLRGINSDPLRAHFAWREIMHQAQRAALLTPEAQELLPEDAAFRVFEDANDAVRGCHYLDRSMYVDCSTWLPDDILHKVDRGTMAHSLEARAPFLDYRLVELCASLPLELKMKGKQQKIILREAMKHRLPDSILRRPKEGFNAPIAHWLSEPAFEPLVRDVLENPAQPLKLFEPKALHGLWVRHTRRAEDNSLILFSLIVLNMWCKRFGATL